MAATRRPEVANLKTSEVMRRAASELDAFTQRLGVEERAVGNELRVRARWIEVARNDPGVSEERRLGVAAIEDSQP